MVIWKNVGTILPWILMSPFMELQGYHPPCITSPLKDNMKVQSMEDHLQHHQEVLQILNDNLVTSKNMMKKQANEHGNERSFEEEDWLFLRLQPYKQMPLKKLNKDNNLEPKYYCPYKVLQKIGSMSYKLELLESSQVNLVFHVSY